jgi:tRNA(Ser,Leu) C12 N-acetylase TAN1
MHTGFFVSCRLSKESRALREITLALQELAERPDSLYMHRNSPDYERMLEEEIRAYKSSSGFAKYIGYKNTFYLENKSPVPSKELFGRLRESRRRFEYVQRVVPMESFFRFNEARILKEVEGLDSDRTYRITFEGRLCDKEMRSKIFGLITQKLRMKVSLTSPFYNIIVHVFKTYVGISVMNNRECSFNFSSEA